jgi:hypothetical protein
MSVEGHSRPARAGTKPGHVRYAPIAIKFRSEAKCRDVPTTDIFDSAALRRFGHVNYFTKNHSFHVGKEAVALRQLQ